MRVNWTRTVQPASAVLTLADVKAQARLTHEDENALLTSYASVADAAAEDYLGYGLLTQTIRLTGDEWPARIWLPMALQLQAVSSVEYYDESGVLQTLAPSAYIVDDMTRPASIVPAVNVDWPSLQAGREAWRWRVVYVAGWETADAVPERIKQGLRLYVTHLDENRSGTDTDAATARRAAEYCWADRIVFVPPYACEASA